MHADCILVYADCIANQDLQLASANGRDSGGRLPPIRSALSPMLSVRQEQIADELRSRFKQRHLAHRGPLQEYHLQTMNIA